MILIGRFGRGSQRQRALRGIKWADSVFHKDFKSMPWWWEWWHPTNELSQDPPRKNRRAGGGRRLWRPCRRRLELARLGCRGDGAGSAANSASAPRTRQTAGGVSGGTTPRQGLSRARGVKSDPEEMEEGHDPDAGPTPPIISLAQVQTVIEREGPSSATGRMSGPLQRRFSPPPRPLRRAGRQGRHLQCERRFSAPI